MTELPSSRGLRSLLSVHSSAQRIHVPVEDPYRTGRRHERSRVGGSPVHYQVSANIGVEQSLGVVDAFVAERIELVAVQMGRRQARQIFCSRGRGRG